MNKVILGIGGNLGQRELFLAYTRKRVAERIGRISAASGIYETDAWGMQGAAFLNQVIEVETEMSAQEVLRLIRDIERSLGRKRNPEKKGYSSRTADIDILFCDDQVIEEEDLEVPHPGIAERRFVLVPLNDIAADLMHPTLNKSMRTLLEECTDTTEVRTWASHTAI